MRGSITGINTVLPPVVVIPGIGGGLRERSTLRAAEGARTCDAPIAQATHVGSTAAALRIRADPTNTCGWCDGRHAFPPENAPGSSHRASPAGRTQVYLVRCDAPIAQATHVGSTAAALRIRADPTNTRGWCDGQHAFPPENAPGSSHRQPGLVGIIPLPLVLYQQPCIIPSQARLV